MSEDRVVIMHRRSFWIIKAVLVLALMAVTALVTLRAGEAERRHEYDRARQEFIQSFAVVRYELTGETFCYDPRGNTVHPARYRGNGLYKIKDK